MNLDLLYDVPGQTARGMGADARRRARAGAGPPLALRPDPRRSGRRGTHRARRRPPADAARCPTLARPRPHGAGRGSCGCAVRACRRTGSRPMAGTATRSRTGRVRATRAATTWPTGAALPCDAVGPGAHAFDGRTRRWNAARLDAYVQPLSPPADCRPAAPSDVGPRDGRGGAPHPRPRTDRWRRRCRRDRAHSATPVMAWAAESGLAERATRRTTSASPPVAVFSATRSSPASSERRQTPATWQHHRGHPVAGSLTLPQRDGGTILTRVSTLTARVLTEGVPPVARRIRRPLGPLDLRAQAILRAVIEEYVSTATPGRQPGARREVQPARVQRDGAQRPRGARDWQACSRTRTPRPAASPRTSATATTSSRSSTRSRCRPSSS